MGDIQGDLVLVHLLRRIGRRSSPNICHFAEVSWQVVKIPDGGRSAGDEMAHATSGVAVVVATLVVAFAADLVSAQTCTESDNFPACHTYLQSPIMLTPDPYCCLVHSSVQTTWGAPCYWELLATVNPNLINMTKACALPRDCNVEADMSKCPCGGTSSTATPIPSAGPRTPPAGLFTYTPCCWFTNASWFRYNATRVYNADCPKLWNSDSCEWFFSSKVVCCSAWRNGGRPNGRRSDHLGRLSDHVQV